MNLGLDRAPAQAGPPPGTCRSTTDRRRRPRGGLDLPDPDPRLQAELAQEVQFLLGRLPLPYRTVLVLRDLEGFSSAEVAAILGRREATVRWRLAKAREMFREQWEARHGPGGPAPAMPAGPPGAAPPEHRPPARPAACRSPATLPRLVVRV